MPRRWPRTRCAWPARRSSGAMKLAVSMGPDRRQPDRGRARPRPARSIPRHWSPEQAREFLMLMEGDRLHPLWAFLLGSGCASASWCGPVGRTPTSSGGGCTWSSSRRRSGTRWPRRPGRAARRFAASSSTTVWCASCGPSARPRPRSAWRRRVRRQRPRLHPSRGRLLPPRQPVEAPRPAERGGWSPPPDGSRPASHVRHPHARQRRAAEGRAERLGHAPARSTTAWAGSS